MFRQTIQSRIITPSWRLSRRAFGDESEYAFEMASSATRFGRGVSREVGYDLRALGVNKNVCLMTDRTLVNLPPVLTVADALKKAGVEFTIFDDVQVEPTDKSMMRAIEFCRSKNFDAFVAVGGGSVMDTAKTANLYQCHPEAEFLLFVNAPIGKGQPITKKLKPLIAIPTTAGTGSETTGVAIFDHMETGAKTGIRDRALRPTLGVIDPDHTRFCSQELTLFSGLDVLCHALESFTAVPFNKRGPRPATPQQRPAYQGCNPVADIWSGFALQKCSTYLPRALKDGGDLEAREAMCLASSAAGVGFGNAGVHLCHGMSYPIASNVKTFRPKTGYQSESIVKKAIVPHGLSVVLTAPAVFRWTCSADPDRHLKAAELLGLNVATTKPNAAGEKIAEYLQNLISQYSFVPNGLIDVGYSTSDIDKLVKGTLPQRKVLDIAPRQPTPDDLGKLFENSMRLY